MKFFYFVAIFAIIFALFNAQTTYAQQDVELIAIKVTTFKPLAQMNLTEFTSITMDSVWSIMNYAVDRLDKVDAVMVTKADFPYKGATEYELELAFNFKLKNQAKDNKQELVDKMNRNKILLITALALALSSTPYSQVFDVQARVIKVNPVCFQQDSSVENLAGYTCGSFYNAECSQLLCLPNAKCQYPQDCMSGICALSHDSVEAKAGVKRCARLPPPTF